ncbi:MAG: hypothetical protein AABX13_03255 [Nanoarchaeota archaeon]
MAHITLSIDGELRQEMKKHPEIKWSEAARRGIRQQLDLVHGLQQGTEWLQRLPEPTRKGLEQLKRFSKDDWKKWQQKMREKEWKRAKSLMPANPGYCPGIEGAVNIIISSADTQTA